MATSVEGDSAKAEEAVPPIGGGRSLTLSDFLNELRETGLAEFAADVGLLPTTALEICGSGPSSPHNTAALKPNSADSPDGSRPTDELPPDDCALLGPAVGIVGDVVCQRAMQVSSYAHRRIERSRRMDHCEGLGRCEEAPGGKAEALAGARRGKRGRGRAEGPRGRAAGKGLRHFSTKVCEKVENKGVTTYNEVADELVVELAGVDKAGKLDDNDEKNIRRRVYDALNVLLAMGIISKEKKQIDWKGLPCSSDRHARALGGQRIKILESIERKQRHLQELVNNYVAIRSLLERNKDAPLDRCPNLRALKLPCIFVQVPASAGVVIQLTEDCLDANFDFQDYPFQLHDEMHVLQQMGLQGPKAAGPLAVQEDTHSAKAIDVRAPSAAGKKQRLARHADLQNAVLTLSKVDVPCPGRADSVSAASNCEFSNGTGLSGDGGEYKLQSPGRNHCQHWLSPLKLGCSMPSAYFPAMANHA